MRRKSKIAKAQEKKAAAKKALPKPSGPRHLPDLEKKALVATLAEKPVGGPRIPDQAGQVLPSVLAAGTTPEQRATQTCSALLTKLMQDDANVRATLQAMIGWRQAHAIAHRHLQELMAKRTSEGEGVELLEDFMLQYVAYQSTKAFSAHTLMQSMATSLLPWLADVVDEYATSDAQAQFEDKQASDKDRRERSLPLGFPLFPPVAAEQGGVSGSPVLVKEKTLVLVGWRNAVLWLLDQLCDVVRADAAKFQVVRFSYLPDVDKNLQAAFAPVARGDWAGCANNANLLARCMGAHVVDKLTSQPDLLIVDHLADAWESKLATRPDGARAGDAHKTLRKWCDRAGAGLVAGLLCAGESLPDLAGPEFAQLQSFALVRGLAVTFPTAEDVQLTLGNSATFIVKRTLLDAYSAPVVLAEG